jgi:hypothetical protein
MIRSISPVTLTLHVLEWTCISVLGILVVGVLHELARLSISPQRARSLASRLQAGDAAPRELGAELADHSIVLLLSTGCKPCEELMTSLSEFDFGSWSLTAVVRGPQRTGDRLTLPIRARRIYDEDGRLFEKLGVSMTPTVLAFVNGLLVRQELGPTTSWFNSLTDPRFQVNHEEVSDMIGG